MIKLTFTKDQFKQLVTHSNLCGDVLKNENINTYFVTNGNKINVYHYGQGVILNADLDIKEVSQDGFFVVPFDKFIADLSKIFESADEATVEYADDNIFTFKNTKMTLTLKGFKVVDATQIEEIKNAYDTKAKALATAQKITITSDLLNFNALVLKYMNLTTDCNAVTITKDSLKYLDRMIIATKKATGISEADNPYYIVKNYFGLLDKLFKVDSAAKITLADNSTSLMFDIGIVKGVLAQNNISIAMPSDEEIAEALPDENDITKITVNRTDLVDTFKSFEGIFDSTRKMSKTYVKSSDAGLKAGHLLFTFADAFNKIESKLPITFISSTNPDTEFIISLSSLVDAADIIGNVDVLNIDYSSIAIGEPHGSGIKIYDNDGNVVYLMKFFE